MNNETDNKASDEKLDTSTTKLAESKKGILKFLDSFVAVLGIGEDKPQKTEPGARDVGTILAHKRTDLAMERTYWAAQRTLMGWIRTSLSMISFGFTIGKLGQSLKEIEVKGLAGTSMIGVDTIAYILVIIGTLALLGAALQYRKRVSSLIEQGLRRQLSIEFAVSLVICVMGFVAFGTLVMKI